VSEDDREQIVRLALDDAVRKSLPKIDRFLQSRGRTGAINAGNAAGAPIGADRENHTTSCAPRTARQPPAATAVQCARVDGDEDLPELRRRQRPGGEVLPEVWRDSVATRYGRLVGPLA
jgi:hypothetical protein